MPSDARGLCNKEERSESGRKKVKKVDSPEKKVDSIIQRQRPPRLRSRERRPQDPRLHRRSPHQKPRVF
ncbi:hypothetical protein TNCV_4869321 [Trichonephila clavipes]|nr:hypothetical protein TNCV_4869321 [Trichonephila clavipes]